MQLLGANPAPQSVGLEELPGKANYFRGNDPQQWPWLWHTYRRRASEVSPRAYELGAA